MRRVLTRLLLLLLLLVVTRWLLVTRRLLVTRWQGIAPLLLRARCLLTLCPCISPCAVSPSPKSTCTAWGSAW